MILVEGPDNAGKTTVIKRLLELDPSLRILKRERYRPERGESIGTSHLQALIPEDGDRIAHGNSIADRFYASECIYGQLFRGKSRFTPAEHMSIKAMLHSYEALVLFVDPGDEAIRKSWEERQQLYAHDPILIAQTYRRELERIFHGFPVFRYSYVDDPRSRTLGEVIKYHHHRRASGAPRLAWWSAPALASAGRLCHPGLVLVGESPSPRAVVPVPFVHGPAGDFLAWTLQRVGEKMGYDPLASTYFTNAVKGTRDDAAVLRDELRALEMQPHTSVVALGKTAAAMLTYIKQPHVAIPHPQYWRRFKYEDRHAYVQMLQDALSQNLSLALG